MTPQGRLSSAGQPSMDEIVRGICHACRVELGELEDTDVRSQRTVESRVALAGLLHDWHTASDVEIHAHLGGARSAWSGRLLEWRRWPCIAREAIARMVWWHIEAARGYQGVSR